MLHTLFFLAAVARVSELQAKVIDGIQLATLQIEMKLLLKQHTGCNSISSSTDC